MPYKDSKKQKQWYIKNRERVIARAALRYQEKKEEIKEYSRKYHQDNREKHLEQFKNYRTNNKEKYRASIDSWVKNHKDEYMVWKKKWARDYAKKNRAVIYARDVKRRQLKKDSLDETTDFEKIKQFYILAENLTERTGQKYVVDHIVPIIKGGKHHQDNLQVITSHDNLRKGSKYPFEISHSFNPSEDYLTHV